MVRLNSAPSGSTCSTTPEASSGAERLASWALETIRDGSKTVTAPRPMTSMMWPSGSTVTTAAVSSSTPIPSSCGDWATIISSRP